MDRSSFCMYFVGVPVSCPSVQRQTQTLANFHQKTQLQKQPNANKMTRFSRISRLPTL